MLKKKEYILTGKQPAGYTVLLMGKTGQRLPEVSGLVLGLGTNLTDLVKELESYKKVGYQNLRVSEVLVDSSKEKGE